MHGRLKLNGSENVLRQTCRSWSKWEGQLNEVMVRVVESGRSEIIKVDGLKVQYSIENSSKSQNARSPETLREFYSTNF